MRIGIGADHRGFRLKEELKKFLKGKNYQIKDFGTFSEEPCDYPDFAFPLSEALVKKKINRGILICGSGLGMTISANKVKGIRAALCLNKEMAKMARNHNNANILVLAANFTSLKEAKKIVLTFLNENFEGGRHLRRINKIKNYENNSFSK
ncbi:MAG: ribose 5-phosphate isomerase B [candidate division WOR-3 bacterium]|nr:ribose 5-phosphate isomerase B [candidate division WOR-3 bacterium]MCX7837000.1 ribose 5-phosphate isomerase B [candidate division WOR-3 bacterium]MDW8114078.1 ribose 5-phosphate isomerase B [candidate division WOR-3 bacterium]